MRHQVLSEGPGPVVLVLILANFVDSVPHAGRRSTDQYGRGRQAEPRRPEGAGQPHPRQSAAEQSAPNQQATPPAMAAPVLEAIASSMPACRSLLTLGISPLGSYWTIRTKQVSASEATQRWGVDASGVGAQVQFQQVFVGKAANQLKTHLPGNTGSFTGGFTNRMSIFHLGNIALHPGKPLVGAGHIASHSSVELPLAFHKPVEPGR